MHTNKETRLIFICAVVAITSFAGTINIDNAKEYFLSVGKEHLHFVANPQAGYVLKTRNDLKSINTMNQLMKSSGDFKVISVGGSGHKDISIIYNNRSTNQNNRTIRLLKFNDVVQYEAPLYSSNGETVAIIPEIVVRVEPNTEIEQVQAICDMVGCSIIKPLEFTTQEYLLEVLGPDADAVLTSVEQLNEMSIVEWACPNIASQPNLSGQAALRNFAHDELLLNDASVQDANEFGISPNDEYFSEQWYLHNTGQICRYGTGGIPNADINAPEAWEITTGDPNITIAVLDMGIDMSHPDLINNLVSGYDFYDDDNLPNPSLNVNALNAHGTACAGIIAAQGNNNIGISGIAYNCKIMPIRICRTDSMGNEDFITESDKATALRWAANHGADILSNSWGNLKTPRPILHSGIKDVTEIGGMGRDGKGCVVLFCAYNAGESLKGYYPQSYPEGIVVGASDHNDKHWYYSNWGSELDIVAPGGGLIVSDISGGFQCTTDISGSYGVNNRWMPDVYGPIVTLDMDYRYFGGTSGATPIAAGIAALILSIEPNLTNIEVRHFLEHSAKDLGDLGKDDYYGWGRVDARAALDMALAKRCDLNNNWKVDVDDFLILLNCWDTNDISGDIAPAAKRDGVVDLKDFELMLQYWQTEIPEPNLIAHWKLDEEEGLIAYDSSGYYHDANVIGDPIWQLEDGMIDGALEFDGIDDCIRTPFVLNPKETSAFSVFAWIKGGLPDQVIISQNNSSDWLSINTEGCLMTELKGGRGASDLISEVVVTDGEWHRIGFTWDGVNRILYVDDFIATIDTQGELPSSAGGLYIGAGRGQESGNFWTGLIDDVRIYNRVITPQY